MIPFIRTTFRKSTGLSPRVACQKLRSSVTSVGNVHVVLCFRNLQHRCGYQLWLSYRTIVISESCHASDTQCPLNLPDVEEVPSYDGELFSVLPEPPISLNDIGPILHPQAADHMKMWGETV
ncbi:hypothetical protein TNCV_2971921 [Trichonephila clavipes]|nr:hypothetical protein TNCV_2971921 [Trichonephila clavipes]